ncbi:hypothetical protein JCM11491_000020 [Sporobolomyces phaffii]
MSQSDADRPPPTFYASQHYGSSSVDHSTSHAGFASLPQQQQQQLPRPSFHRPTSTVGPPTSHVGGVVAGGDRYLAAAQAIELTQEEKQEGYYDQDLLQARPRNTAANLVSAPPRPPPQQPSRPSSPPLPASSFPYASRARDDDHATSIDRKASRSGRDPVGAKIRLEEQGGVGRYPSRPSKDPNQHSRSGGGSNARNRDGTRAGPARRTRTRRRKELKWWQKPKTFVALIGLIVVVAIAVGLGVGLTVGRKEDNERSPGNPNTSNNGGNPGGGGVQPSVSAAAAATSEQIRPTISLAARDKVATTTIRRCSDSE